MDNTLDELIAHLESRDMSPLIVQTTIQTR